MRKLGLVLTVAISSLAACNRSSQNDMQGDEGTQTAPNTDLGTPQQSPEQGQQQPGQAQPGQAQPGAQQGQGTPGDQAAGWRGGGDAGMEPGSGTGTSPGVPKSRDVTPEEGTRGSGQTTGDGGTRKP